MTKPTITHATVASRQPGRWSRAAAVAACLAIGPLLASAADDIVAADRAAVGGTVTVGAKGVVFAANVNAAGVAVAAKANNNVNNINKQVDQWFFPRGQSSAKRAALEVPLAMQLAELRRCCHLSDAQDKKLALAMQYDVSLFFDAIDELREQYLRVGVFDAQIQQRLSPLQVKSQTGDLCGSGSFFAKTLNRVLDDEQLSRYRAIADERHGRRYLSTIDVAMQELEQRCPLDSRQYETIQRLLAEQPPPHRSTDGASMLLLVTYRLSQIPSDQLRPVFDEVHWNAFQQDRLRFQINRARLQYIGLLPGGLR